MEVLQHLHWRTSRHFFYTPETSAWSEGVIYARWGGALVEIEWLSLSNHENGKLMSTLLEVSIKTVASESRLIKLKPFRIWIERGTEVTKENIEIAIEKYYGNVIIMAIDGA